MKTTPGHLLLVSAIIFATWPTQAHGQSDALIEQLRERTCTAVASAEATARGSREIGHRFLAGRKARRRASPDARRLNARRNCRANPASPQAPGDEEAAAEATQRLESELEELNARLPVSPPSNASPAGVLPPIVTNVLRPQPSFLLGDPVNGATNQPLTLTLAWTEAAGATEYTVFISDDSSFSNVIIQETVQPSTTSADVEFSIEDKHGLKAGTTYFWKVEATLSDGTTVSASNGPFKFTTARNFFEGLSKRGFKLQKALTGPDKGELAEFSVLNTIGEKTVFSTNFALSWKPTTQPTFGNTAFSPEFSVEANLASDESEAEDAWRFRFSAIFDTSFFKCQVAVAAGQPCPPRQLSRPTFEGLYTKVSLKFEGDKDFDTKKLSGEFLISPNSRALAIGAARPDNIRKVQFRWRPFFRIDAGHTFRRGASEEKKDTIFRLVPRVRANIFLQPIREKLNLSNLLIFADNTFFYLPLEDGRRKFNFFTGGLEIDFTENLGVGLTYKNGRSAPKFEKMNTLQFVLGVRF